MTTALSDALNELMERTGATAADIEQALRDMRQQQLMEQLKDEAATAILRTLVRESKRRRYTPGGGE